MKDVFKIGEMIGNGLVRAGQALGASAFIHPRYDRFDFVGTFTAEVVRRMGVKMEPRTVAIVHGHNDPTTEGVNRLWDTFFGKGTPLTQIDPWYIGLINNTPSPTLAQADVLSSHSGWAEFTSYSGNRKAWVDADSASRAKGTTTVSTFTMTGSGDIYGIFLASVASGTSGVLWNTGAFSTIPSVISGDDLKVTYGIRG